MKQALYILISLSIAIAFIGCSKDNTIPGEQLKDGEGAIKLNVPMPDTLNNITVIQTKSGFGIDPKGMMITFLQQQSNGNYSQYKTFDTYNDFILAGMPFVMEAGTYRVVASSFDRSKNSDGISKTPYFEGSQEFPVEEKQITNVTSILCSFRSVGIEVKPSDRLWAKIKAEPANYSYKIKVSNGITSWTFDSETNIVPVYFLDASTELTVKLNIVLDGETYPERTYYINNSSTGKVSINEYYIINIDSDTNDQTKSFSLSAKCVNPETV